MPIKVTVEDHTDFFKTQKDLAIERALEIIGAKAEGYAKGLCPVGTPKSTGIPGYIGGTLRNSITYVTAKKTGTTITVEKGTANPTEALHGGSEEGVGTAPKETVIIGTNVFYAPYVEAGTSKRRAKPFLKPAVFKHLNEYKGIIENELKKGS